MLIVSVKPLDRHNQNTPSILDRKREKKKEKWEAIKIFEKCLRKYFDNKIQPVRCLQSFLVFFFAFSSLLLLTQLLFPCSAPCRPLFRLSVIFFLFILLFNTLSLNKQKIAVPYNIDLGTPTQINNNRAEQKKAKKATTKNYQLENGSYIK